LLLPAVCDISVTNVCNAACDFCGFSRDKTPTGATQYLDVDKFEAALPILKRRGIRYVTFQGCEPLVHPDIVRLVSLASAAQLSPAVITNGWFLPRCIDLLAEAGLSELIVSLDSPNLTDHERNRGLPGLELRRRRLLPALLTWVQDCRVDPGGGRHAQRAVSPQSDLPASRRAATRARDQRSRDPVRPPAG